MNGRLNHNYNQYDNRYSGLNKNYNHYRTQHKNSGKWQQTFKNYSNHKQHWTNNSHHINNRLRHYKTHNDLYENKLRKNWSIWKGGHCSNHSGRNWSGQGLDNQFHKSGRNQFNKRRYRLNGKLRSEWNHRHWLDNQPHLFKLSNELKRQLNWLLRHRSNQGRNRLNNLFRSHLNNQLRTN